MNQAIVSIDHGLLHCKFPTDPGRMVRYLYSITNTDGLGVGRRFVITFMECCEVLSFPAHHNQIN